MGWRSIIIGQHAKITHSAHMMVVQTKDGGYVRIIGVNSK